MRTRSRSLPIICYGRRRRLINRNDRDGFPNRHRGVTIWFRPMALKPCFHTSALVAAIGRYFVLRGRLIYGQPLSYNLLQNVDGLGLQKKLGYCR